MGRCYFFLVIALLLGCPNINPIVSEDGLIGTEGEVIFSALKKGLTPPLNFCVELDGVNPVLKWSPNVKGAYYRLYRKANKDEQYQVVDNANIVVATTFKDESVSRLTHNDIFYYRISTIDQFGREGFLSNPVSVVLSSPDFNYTPNLVSASLGFFDDVKVGTTTVVRQNKLGVLLKISRPTSYQVDEADTWGFLIYRKEINEVEYTLVESDFSPTQSYYDTQAGGELFYFVDVPPSQGVFYNYLVRAFNGLGAKSSASNTKEGYVYSTPQIVQFDSFPLQGKPGGLNIFVGETPFCDFVNIYATKNLALPFVKISSRHKIDHQKSSIDSILDVSQIFSALGESEALHGTYYYYIEGSYSVFNSSEDTEAFTTPPSLVKSCSIYSASLATLELPVVSLLDGEKELGTLTVTKPITLSWPFPNDSGISGYKIYRTRTLNFEKSDKTNWGEAIKEIPLPSSREAITFSDNSSDLDFGAYYYMVNPIAGDLESFNNLSISQIAMAAILPSSLPDIDATMRASSNSITLTCPTLSRENNPSLVYIIENKNVSRGWHTVADDLAASGGLNKEFVFNTSVVGLQSFRLKAAVLFKNGNTLLEKRVGLATSSEALGAIEIDNKKWIELVMQTVVEAQREVLPSERMSATITNGGFYKKVSDNLTFLRRSYYSYCSNEKFDGLKFTSYPSACSSITLNGNLYHLYFDKGSSLYGYDKIINLSYSGSIFPEALSSDTDKLEKKFAPINIEGIYPGEIYLWFKNGGYEHRNDDAGFLPLGDYPASEIYISANTKKLKWFKDSYGLFVTQDDTKAFNLGGAYSIKRDDESTFTSITYSQVGALQ